MAQTIRIAAWTIFLLAAAARPFIDRIDRALVGRSWNEPSEWNAVADISIRTGVVDGRIGGAPAPWRQASVLPLGGTRVGVVTVSDMATSRSTFITDEYRVLGVLTRQTSDASLVTDETRGYKPLSHIWPIVEQDRRLLTLVSMAPLLSDPVRFGVFAYVALGAQDNEVLFVCRLVPGPGPTWGELMRLDVNGDGADDLVVYERGQRNDPPIAVFTADPRTRAYSASITEPGSRLVAAWVPSPGERVLVPREAPIDQAVQRLVTRLPPAPR